MSANILLISIKPEYAKKIFEDKTKQVELRKVRARRLNNGDIVVVYISSPVQAFVGWFEVNHIKEVQASKKELKCFWEEIQNQAGISKQEFHNYYLNASFAVGIFLKNVQTFERPIQLKSLQKKLPNLRPPQCYRYLNQREYEVIKSLGFEKNTTKVKQTD